MSSTSFQDSERIAFGERIRRLRGERGWTLTDLADRSGLAISTISKAERGLIALTYDRLMLLARGLEVDVSAFFSDSGTGFAAGSFALARKGDFRRQETPNYVYDMLFSELWNKSMQPMLGTLKARERAQFDSFVSHKGQEFLMVLDGSVTVHLEGRDPVTLDSGDSIYFDSTIGHIYATAGEQDARILVVCESLAEG